MAVYSAWKLFVGSKQSIMGKATSVCSDSSNLMACFLLVYHDFITNFLMDHLYNLLRRLILLVVRMYTLLYCICTSITGGEMWDTV